MKLMPRNDTPRFTKKKRDKDKNTSGNKPRQKNKENESGDTMITNSSAG